MKKSIKRAAKKDTSPIKKNVRPFTAIKGGYKEEIYNNEQQEAYQKSDAIKNNKENTAGPKA